MSLVDIYGPVPNGLPIEEEAIRRSTRHFPEIGTVCLKSQLDEYDSYTILDTKDNWHFIEVPSQLELTPNGLKPLTGFIPRESKVYPVSEGKAKPLSEIVSTAYNYIGVPYKWGAKSKIATDCSGLIYQIYREHGIILPRYADGQFQVSQEVEQLAPGDLIFVVINKPIHVLMYLGNGEMIESCGLPEVFITRVVTFQDKWDKPLSNGDEVARVKVYFRRLLNLI